MSRQRPSDNFTRFTSTAPQNSSSSSPLRNSSFTPHTTPAEPGQNIANQRPSHLPPSSSHGPDGETPAQKVARLRAAARQAKERSQLSTTDRIIARGRFWADFAHRATTYSLLLFTGVSSVVAVYGLVSLVSHNRRQKRAWIEREMNRLHDAQQAFLRGEANAEQLHLLEQERAGEEIAKKFKEDKEKRKAEGVFGRIKGTFGNFLGQGSKGVESSSPNIVDNSELSNAWKGEGRSEGLVQALDDGWLEENSVQRAAVKQSHIAGVGLDDKGRPVPINKLERVSRKIEDERRSGERQVTARTGITGGPLDALADNMAKKVVPATTAINGQSWWNWATGGSSKSS